MLGIRWSDETQAEKGRHEEVRKWYYAAIKELEEGKAKLLGRPVNLLDPIEVIAFLYVYGKEYAGFHESF